MATSKPEKAATKFSTQSFLRFVLVGGSATTIHYALIVFFVWTDLLAPVAASAVGYVLSAIFNYGTNAIFTFKGNHRHIVSFPRFAVTAGMGCLINTVIISLLEALGVQFVVSQLFATATVMIWNYTISVLWTFGPQTK